MESKQEGHCGVITEIVFERTGTAGDFDLYVLGMIAWVGWIEKVEGFCRVQNILGQNVSGESREDITYYLSAKKLE